MSFNFHRTPETQSCPINWAIGVPSAAQIDPAISARELRPLSPQELMALIHELGLEGSLDPLQLKVLHQLPELSHVLAAE